MIDHEYSCQPQTGNYRSLFERAMQSGSMNRFDVAVAYATEQGVRTLVDIMGQSASNRWDHMRKRWLVGIDWCRTEPPALDMLSQMKSSEVKIFAGREVVRRRNCVPKLPFHPKGFLLRGADKIAVIAGSGNLSRNGLRHGHEIGGVLVCAQPLAAHEQIFKESCDRVCAWFDNNWLTADTYAELRLQYLKKYENAENLRSPPPTEDDAIESDEPAAARQRRGGLIPDQLRKLRVCRHFWIQFVRNPNRGERSPGTQLMMSRMMRVFFGFPPEDLPRKTTIGNVALQFGSSKGEFTLNFAHNGMDVLNLPLPLPDWPQSYDDKTLLFERLASGSKTIYQMTVGMPLQIKQWQRRSREVDGAFEMSSGRPWGVY